ncbi:hypothetical protein J6590_105381 [Homalodisca vitripennis]|nr:hypothetical protein J6590_105381 [Homalodisca vitripennis]
MFGEYHHLMHDLEADDDKFRTYLRLNKEQFDEGDQGALCACASHRSFADVGQESLQPHIPADGGRRDERCATSVMSVLLVLFDNMVSDYFKNPCADGRTRRHGSVTWP